MIKLEKIEQQKLARELLEKGEVIALAEYRGFRTDQKKMALKERPDIKEDRVIVTHSVELAGSGEQIACAEFMPSGTRPEDCKAPLNQGDRCLVVFNALKFQGSARQGSPRRFELLSKLLP